MTQSYPRWDRAWRVGDHILPWSRWFNVIDIVYFAFWTVLFAILSFVTETTCAEPVLTQFGPTAFWMIFAIFLFSGFTTLVVWNYESFTNGNPYEFWAYMSFIATEIILAVIIIIWSWTAAGKSTKVAGCEGLYDSAVGFGVITAVYMILMGVLSCILLPIYYRKYADPSDDYEAVEVVETKA